MQGRAPRWRPKNESLFSDYEEDLLRWLLVMPLLDLLDLAAVAGLPVSTTHRLLVRLQECMLLESVHAGIAGQRKSARWYLTAPGLAAFAANRAMTMQHLLRQHPCLRPRAAPPADADGDGRGRLPSGERPLRHQRHPGLHLVPGVSTSRVRKNSVL